MNSQPLCFTTAYDGIARELKNKVYISSAFDPSSAQEIPQKTEYIAIWDTGATHSVISDKVINECNLKPISVVKVYHAGGESFQEVFLICIFLPSQLCVTDVKATRGYLPGDSDVLIGMDIIGKGDFAVTNKDNKTVFSFRFPSITCIDFVKQHTPKIGRNDPCYCGSNKKFKHCHGKIL